MKPDAGKRAAQSESKPAAEKKPFVDRQLEMAVKYLRDELAKKKESRRKAGVLSTQY